MPVKIRLQRKGRKKRPFYHIVIADSRSPRDGRFIERIGVYNPMTSPATIEIDRDSAFDWLQKGAQPTNTVRAILRFKGVLYRKHLQRGVDKGAMTQEEADVKYQAWIDQKEGTIASRVEATAKAKADLQAKISGVAAPKAKPVEEVVEEVAEAVAEVAEEATEAVAEATESSEEPKEEA